MSKIQISKAGLAVDIAAGLKKEDIIKKYSTATIKLTGSDVSNLMKQCGFKFRKFKRPNYEIIEDVAVPYNAVEIKKEAELGNTAILAK